MNNRHYKIITLGNSTVGKTSLINRIMYNVFKDTYSTIGASYFSIKMPEYNIGIWDTAGQEKFSSLINFYYRGTYIYLMVYDVSNMNSIDKLFKYFDIIRDDMDTNANIFIIGNKIDLIDEDPIMMNKLKQYIKSKLEEIQITNDIYYYFMSAKRGQGINDIYNDIILLCTNKMIPINKDIKKIDRIDPEQETTYYSNCQC